MADLGDVIGTFLGSLAHARRMADEESAAIAEYYRTNPLLEGMSLPRIRVPEMVLEIPVLVEGFEEGTENVTESTTKIKTEVGKELKGSADALGIALPANFRKDFEAQIGRNLKKLDSLPQLTGRGQPREAVVRIVESAFVKLAERNARAFPSDKRKALLTNLRQKSAEVAVRKAGRPAAIKASVLTAEVKEHADAANVTRLRIVLKEEGLEWSVYENPDGSVTRKLTPE